MYTHPALEQGGETRLLAHGSGLCYVLYEDKLSREEKLCIIVTRNVRSRSSVATVAPSYRALFLMIDLSSPA